MIITREQNIYTRSGQLKVVENQKVVDDKGIRTSIGMMISRRQVKIAKLKHERENTFKLVQYYQKLALTTDDHIKARQTQEYLDQILIIDLHKIDREIKALYKEIDELKRR